MVGVDPVTIQVLEKIGTVVHADGVVVEGRSVPDQQLGVGVRRGVVESQQAFQDPRHVELEGFLRGARRAFRFRVEGEGGQRGGGRNGSPAASCSKDTKCGVGGTTRLSSRQ